MTTPQPPTPPQQPITRVDLFRRMPTGGTTYLKPSDADKPPLGDIEATRAWLATRPAQPATITIDTLPDSVWVVAVEFAGSRNPVAATGTRERAELVATALAHYETTQPGVLFAHLAATTGTVPTAWPDVKPQENPGA